MSASTPSALVTFSTHSLPARDRLPFWREVFGRHLAQIEIEPKSDRPIEAQAAVLPLPGLAINWCHSFTPACWKRTAEIVRDGDDRIVLLVSLDGMMTYSQLGRELELCSGDGVGVLNCEPARIEFSELNHVAVGLRRAPLAELVADLEHTASRLIPARSEPLRLLLGYVAALRTNPDIQVPALCTLAVTHIYDLVAMALGATSDGMEMAMARGVRAARLSAIKSDLAANPSLSLRTLAARQNLTPRYVQMLFEAEGTTFTAHASELRLSRAYRMLISPRFGDWSVSAIALHAGFGDISHFNRSFRRRFGASPSDIRAEALRTGGGDGR